MKDAEKRFEEYREHLHLEAMRLVDYICLYRRLHERKQDRLDELNIAPNFFQVTLDALFSAIILWVDKLLSCNSERGFIDFLTFVENNLRIFEITQFQRRRAHPDGHRRLNCEPITAKTVQEDRDKIIKGIKSLCNFKLRRDKFHAHFDRKYFFNRSNLSKDAPLKLSDMEQVIEVMGDVINRYSAAYDGNVYKLEPFNVNDVDYLLDILHEYKKKEDS